MDTPIHEEIYRDHTIKIIHDPDAESPRDYDNWSCPVLVPVSFEQCLL